MSQAHDVKASSCRLVLHISVKRIVWSVVWCCRGCVNVRTCRVMWCDVRWLVWRRSVLRVASSEIVRPLSVSPSCRSSLVAFLSLCRCCWPLSRRVRSASTTLRAAEPTNLTLDTAHCGNFEGLCGPPANVVGHGLLSSFGILDLPREDCWHCSHLL